MERFFGSDLPGSGAWTIAGRTMSDRIGRPALPPGSPSSEERKHNRSPSRPFPSRPPITEMQMLWSVTAMRGPRRMPSEMSYAGGSFTLDGTAYQLPLNNGPNTLHGGPGAHHDYLLPGFDRLARLIETLAVRRVVVDEPRLVERLVGGVFHGHGIGAGFHKDVFQ